MQRARDAVVEPTRWTREDPLLMIPGPTPVSEAVREAMAAPVRGHGSVENAASLARIQDGVRALTGAGGADVFVLPGSGTLAMEAALVNHVQVGQRVVVVNHGYFADRFVDICAVHGIEVEQVRAPWGQRVPLDDVRALVMPADPPALLVVTHVDTSTGVQSPVRELAQVAHEAGTMMLLDGVCATGGVEESMDEWGVDLLITASQKALAAPPGLAIIVTSRRAREHRQRKGRPGSYYADLARWEAPMSSTAYFATHATTLVRALDVSMQEILAEGLEERYRRHREVAQLARNGLLDMGFTLLTDEEALASTLSVVRPPEGVDEARLRADMLDDGVMIAAGIGPFAGAGVRMGHMGSVGRSEVSTTLAAGSEAVARQLRR